LALALLGLLPELVSAQANALFPDIYIKRKRPCTDLENPQYRMIREQFYGYYPTCWRRFPEGWGCLNPEAPDWAKALEKQPLQQPEAMEGTEEGPGATLPENSPFRNRPATEGRQQGMPELPEAPESLFPNNKPRTPPPGGAGARPAAPGGDQPRPTDPNDPYQTTQPQASAAPLSAAGFGAYSRPEEGDFPPLAGAGSASPSALPAGDSATALAPEGITTPTNGRRGLLSQWFGRFRRR
jgi:hypothetical protein